jgi:predicted O-methyltransferase YrrM
MKKKKWTILIFVVILCISVGLLAEIAFLPLGKKESIAQVLEILPVDFKKTLLSMYEGQDQMGLDGKMHKIDMPTRITPEQGMCIYNLCQTVKPQKTLEIGFAYGFSNLFFLVSIKSNNGGSHTAMDPFEEIYWHGIGLKKTEEHNMDPFFQFIPDYDMFAIPELAEKNQKFDVIFMDGDHRFDYVLLDFTLCDHIISDNGYIILHDSSMPSIKKAVKFIKKNRSDYQVQKDLSSPQMLIVKKISDDKRDWNHYRSF